MGWKFVLAVLCLIGVIALTPVTTDSSNSTMTSDNSTSTVNSTSLTNSSSPTNTANSTNSSSPTNTANSTNSSSPTNTANSTNSSGPTNTANSTNSSSPTNTANSTTTGNSTNTTNSTTTGNSTNTGSSTNSSSPTNPGNSTNSSSPTNPGNFTNPPNSTVLPPQVPSVSFPMSFSSPDTYAPELDNATSQVYTERVSKVKNAIEPVYRNKFKNFVLFKVVRFRKGSVITDGQLLFDQSGPVPNNTELTSILQIAANNASFGLNITASSIKVDAPENITANVTATVTTTPVNGTQSTPLNTTTTNGTTSTTTTAATTATVATTIYSLIFKINDNFNANLSNSSSTQFQEKANFIILRIQPFFTILKSFLRMKINRFLNGSIITESQLEFGDGSVTNVKEIANIMAFAVQNGNLPMNIDASSINVTMILGNAMPPALASSLPLLWMSLASLLLSAVLHF